MNITAPTQSSAAHSSSAPLPNTSQMRLRKGYRRGADNAFDEEPRFMTVVKRAARALSASGSSVDDGRRVESGEEKQAVSHAPRRMPGGFLDEIVEYSRFDGGPSNEIPETLDEDRIRSLSVDRLRRGANVPRVPSVVQEESLGPAGGQQRKPEQILHGPPIPAIPAHLSGSLRRKPTPGARSIVSREPVLPYVPGNLQRKPTRYTMDHIAAYWSWVRRTREADNALENLHTPEDNKVDQKEEYTSDPSGFKALEDGKSIHQIPAKETPPQAEPSTQPSVSKLEAKPKKRDLIASAKTKIRTRPAKTDDLQSMNVPKSVKEERWMKAADWLQLPQVALVHPTKASRARSPPSDSKVQAPCSSTPERPSSPASTKSIPEALRVLGFIGEAIVALAGKIPCYGIDEKMMNSFFALANSEAPPSLRLQGLKNVFFVLGQVLVVVYVMLCFIRMLTLLMEGLQTVFLPLRLVIRVLGWVFKV